MAKIVAATGVALPLAEYGLHGFEHPVYLFVVPGFILLGALVLKLLK